MNMLTGAVPALQWWNSGKYQVLKYHQKEKYNHLKNRMDHLLKTIAFAQNKLDFILYFFSIEYRTSTLVLEDHHFLIVASI
jgi:hypothetical protein